MRNEGLSPDTAAQDLERLAELGVAYVEEPLPAELVKGASEPPRRANSPYHRRRFVFQLARFAQRGGARTRSTS